GTTKDQALTFAHMYFRAATNELLLTPTAPLAPGIYRLNIYTSQDFTTTFTVGGIEGISNASTADDTPAHARQLGDVSLAELIQVWGGIGDDPTSPRAFNPSDVDLYHVQVSGAGNFSLQAEVFAGRIGSSLDAALGLFKVNPADGSL